MIKFKYLTKDLLEWARELHNDPEVLCNLTDPHIVSKKEQKQWFKKLQKSKSSERLVVWVDKQPIGLVRVDNLDFDNKSVCIGLDIHKDFRGKGYAKKIYYRLFERYFEQYHLNRIWLLVADYNTRARHIYTSLGFQEEGAQREALYKKYIYYNYIMMSILRREYYAKYSII